MKCVRLWVERTQNRKKIIDCRLFERLYTTSIEMIQLESTYVRRSPAIFVILYWVSIFVCLIHRTAQKHDVTKSIQKLLKWVFNVLFCVSFDGRDDMPSIIRVCTMYDETKTWKVCNFHQEFPSKFNQYLIIYFLRWNRLLVYDRQSTNRKFSLHMSTWVKWVKFDTRIEKRLLRTKMLETKSSSNNYVWELKTFDVIIHLELAKSATAKSAKSTIADHSNLKYLLVDRAPMSLNYYLGRTFH